MHRKILLEVGNLGRIMRNQTLIIPTEGELVGYCRAIGLRMKVDRVSVENPECTLLLNVLRSRAIVCSGGIVGDDVNVRQYRKANDADLTAIVEHYREQR